MKRFLFLFILGTTVFVVFFKFTVLGLWLSSLAGLAGMLLGKGFFRIIDAIRRSREPGPAPAEKAAREVVAEGMEKLRQISNMTRMIQSNEVAARIKDICKIGVDIFDDIKKSPDDMKRARQFTVYYLDATKKIIEQYVELSGKRNRTVEVEATLKKIEGMLAPIKDTFEKQLANLLEDDLLDINAELAVLKNTIKLER